MTEAERRILLPLARMCDQYLNDDGELDHKFMRAGETALAALSDHGLVTLGPRGGKWTETGKALLDSN